MVEVFKTNIQDVDDANRIIQNLVEQFPNYKFNFDLEDCDRILRAESQRIDLVKIEKILHKLNCNFELLI